MADVVFPDGEWPAHIVELVCFPMTGRRFGVGLIFYEGQSSVGHSSVLRLDAPVASALFPDMAAAGRVYDHLVVAEIER